MPLVAVFCLPALMGGCPRPDTQNDLPPASEPVRFQPVNITDGIHPVLSDQPIVLNVARNEWTNFTCQISLPRSEGYWLKVRPPTARGMTFAVSSESIFQVLAMPVDMDQAGYVRHTGQPAARRNVPRPLLPQVLDSDGVCNLSSLRNPAHPTDPRSRVGGLGADPATLWFDLHIPKGIPAGEYVRGD